jgi:putative aminopeptidase FrvX
VVLGPEDVPGVIASKSHHATGSAEREQVVPVAHLYVDVGAEGADAARALGIEIGTPVAFEPRAQRLAGRRITGTSLDDRAGCAVVLALARALADQPRRPTVHVAFTAQEEFTLRASAVVARTLAPAIAIQIDVGLASDVPDMEGFGELALGAGPALSLYSFHGRGTLNGTMPHPALVSLMTDAAAAQALPLQRTAHVGVLTDSAHVQVTGGGVACVDLCFPCRYAHSPREVCDLTDLEALATLLTAAVGRIDRGFSLERYG